MCIAVVLQHAAACCCCIRPCGQPESPGFLCLAGYCSPVIHQPPGTKYQGLYTEEPITCDLAKGLPHVQLKNIKCHGLNHAVAIASLLPVVRSLVNRLAAAEYPQSKQQSCLIPAVQPAHEL
jgi:hypothetical protein